MSDLINGLRHMADDHPCCRETLQLTIDTIEELEDENAALREDKEILDWLDANVDAIMLKLQPNSFRLDVREMVRKARKETQP